MSEKDAYVQALELKRQYKENEHALEELRLPPTRHFPSLGTVVARFSVEQLAYAASFPADTRPTLTIRPRLDDRALNHRHPSTPKSLIAAFNEQGYDDAVVHEGLLRAYGVDDHNSTGDFAPLPSRSYVAQLQLHDRRNPLNTDMPANSYDIPGLVYTGLNVASQRAALRRERSLYRDRNVVLPTIIDLVLMHTVHRQMGIGEELLTLHDTNLIQYPGLSVKGSVDVVPCLSVNSEQLELHGVPVEDVCEPQVAIGHIRSGGIRRALGAIQ